MALCTDTDVAQVRGWLKQRTHGGEGAKEAEKRIAEKLLEWTFKMLWKIPDYQHREDASVQATLWAVAGLDKIADPSAFNPIGYLKKPVEWALNDYYGHPQPEELTDEEVHDLPDGPLNMDPIDELDLLSEGMEFAMGLLTERQRGVVWLRKVEGREYREIAEMLSMSYDSARQDHCAAMRALRTHFGLTGNREEDERCCN